MAFAACGAAALGDSPAELVSAGGLEVGYINDVGAVFNGAKADV